MNNMDDAWAQRGDDIEDADCIEERRIEFAEKCLAACAGLPDGAIDAGWTAVGMIDYTKQLEAENESLKLHIVKLEAATEHLSLTPQQAKDGLTRHKALIAERDRLQSELTQEIEDSKEIQKVRDTYSAECVRLQSECENLKVDAERLR